MQDSLLRTPNLAQRLFHSNELALKADKVLICDTDLLETKVYSEEFYGGFVHPNLEKAALQNTYDLYFLTYIDAPWKKDDLRDRPEDREKTLAIFEQALIDYKKPYIKLSGNKDRRFQKAVAVIDELIKAKNYGFNSFDLIQFLLDIV